MQSGALRTRMMEGGAVRLLGYVDRFRRGVQSQRRAVALTAYGLVSIVAYYAAFVLCYGPHWPAGAHRAFLLTLPLLVAIRVASDFVFKLSTGRWRFVSTGDVLRLAAATTSGMLLFWAGTRLMPLPLPVPTRIVLLEWLLTGYITAGIWIGYRTLFERLRHFRSGYNGSSTRVLIVGAGEAGNLVAREMLRAPTGYRPMGFVDDDAGKWRTRVYGIEVLGGTAELAKIATSVRAEEIVITVPSATPAELQRIVGACELTGLPCRVLPSFAASLSGEVPLTLLREVRIEDLLGRAPIELDLSVLDEDLRNRCVLITGAAGSIGSELARQVALHAPGRLVLLDQAETDLFFLELELRDRFPELDLFAVVGDIVDAEGVELIFRRFSPDRVFHAAAYKHVPVMEANAREAVRNNVIGTMRIAEASGRHGAAKFVLVSTDKAAQPASIMGATKRLAEMLVLEMQQLHPGTTYTAVRFGNVLGSNGSVIPIFEKQLRAGKPLTVTHPEATRYFMSITEAVQLILQSSVLAELSGNIAVLEMGEPVRVMDLAANMLRLAGAPHLNGDNIVFTGLRPGEKLHEELVAPGEESRPTAVPKVRLIRTPVSADLVTLRTMQMAEEMLFGDSNVIISRLVELFPTLKAEVSSEDEVAVIPAVLYSRT